MRANQNVVLREIMGEHILVPVGTNAAEFMGIMSLNDSGLFLWKLLQNEITEQMLVKALCDEYDIDLPTAEVDINHFLTRLREAKLLE